MELTRTFASGSRCWPVQQVGLDAEEVRADVEDCPESDEEDLEAVAPQVGVALRRQLEQEGRERAHGRQPAGDREVLAAHDVRVEEDEAAQEDLQEEDVAQRDVDDPPQVGPEAERELGRERRHVRPGHVEPEGDEPEHDERGADRAFDEALAGVEETRDLVGCHR